MVLTANPQVESVNLMSQWFMCYIPDVAPIIFHNGTIRGISQILHV